MPREWTPEGRAEFGRKMAERRANALAARDSSDSATEEAQVEVTEGKQFATAADIPGGARPITGKREAAALSAEQLVEAPDTGFAATSGAGTGGGLVVESSNVIGSGGSTGPSFAQRSRVENGVVVADRMLEAGDVLPAPNSDRGFGPADPTGLPCSCAMGTTTVGRPKAETWCIVCGGELDGKTRPENALKGRRNVSVRAATALSMQDLEVITAAAEERAYQRLLADLKAGGVIKE